MNFMEKLFGKEKRSQQQNGSTVAGKSAGSKNEIGSPMEGKLIELKDVPDEAFAQGILGDGVAIRPTKGEVYAPADGTVDTLFDTCHAITFLCDNGAELLLHVGLDTVQLKGKHFQPQVASGDRVKKGRLLLQVDLEAVKREGYDTVTPVIVTNGDELPVEKAAPGRVKVGDMIMKSSR